MNTAQKDHFSHFNDDLDEVINAPLREAKAPPASYKPMHFEPCGKCRGTGQTRWGICFRCNGQKGKSYKSSPEKRAQSRATAAARVERKTTGNLEAFKAAHPAVWAWMDGSTFEFAVSLRQAIAKYGDLSEKQLAAAERCVEKLAAMKAEKIARDAERAIAAPTVEIAKIEQSFQNARAKGAKRPKLRLASFLFSLAPDHGKNAGAIYVTETGQYLGKIVGGRFFSVRECTKEQEAAIVAAAADPKAAAIAYGFQTGSCSCCGRELSDPASIALGIGPVCATKYGW